MAFTTLTIAAFSPVSAASDAAANVSTRRNDDDARRRPHRGARWTRVVVFIVDFVTDDDARRPIGIVEDDARARARRRHPVRWVVGIGRVVVARIVVGVVEGIIVRARDDVCGAMIHRFIRMNEWNE
tara:strand:- start:118 stop:498 length:381 start_codon:yes stop_codon:yes gene_type:complete